MYWFMRFLILIIFKLGYGVLLESRFGWVDGWMGFLEIWIVKGCFGVLAVWI